VPQALAKSSLKPDERNSTFLQIREAIRFTTVKISRRYRLAEVEKQRDRLTIVKICSATIFSLQGYAFEVDCPCQTYEQFRNGLERSIWQRKKIDRRRNNGDSPNTKSPALIERCASEILSNQCWSTQYAKR